MHDWDSDVDVLSHSIARLRITHHESRITFMAEFIKTKEAAAVWTEQQWELVERETLRQASRAESEEAAWAAIAREARKVMRVYTTSFFIVTRFLPPLKRAKVEAIYAAVRYPDEIVDTFALSPSERMRRLDDWAARYEEGLAAASVKDALSRGVPCFLAGFTEVARTEAIPPEHYRSFIEAMRRDVYPRPFATLEDLIETYIYGSAIVVGYFLTYVYGARARRDFPRALASARSLAVALQLTNFLRDVGEDHRRGRLYLPLDLLRAEAVLRVDVSDPSQHEALKRVLRRMSAIAEDYYAASAAGLDAFAPDCRTAISACIDVYRKLNDRIGRSPRGILHRESVPMSEKFRVLPASKYWRLPLAYLSR